MSWNQNSGLCAQIVGSQWVEGPSRGSQGHWKWEARSSCQWDVGWVQHSSEVWDFSYGSVIWKQDSHWFLWLLWASKVLNGLSKLELCFGETLSGMRKIKRQCLMTLQPQLLPVLVDLNWQWLMDFLMAMKAPISDCIKAYVQSILSSSQPTYVLLPIELVPDHAKHIHQPCAPLIKSLYGHPLASAYWQNHLSKVLAQELGGFEFEQLPSCFYYPSLRLALWVYVDDLTLSGPRANHSKFWDVLRKVAQLEDQEPLSKVLGRGHIKHDGGLALHLTDFAKQCVKLFEELSGKPFKHARTPHVDEGSLLAIPIRLTEGSYPMLLPSLWWSSCGLVVSADQTWWLRSMFVQVISPNGPSMMTSVWSDLLAM